MNFSLSDGFYAHGIQTVLKSMKFVQEVDVRMKHWKTAIQIGEYKTAPDALESMDSKVNTLNTDAFYYSQSW